MRGVGPFFIWMILLITACGGSGPPSPPGKTEAPIVPKIVVEKEKIDREEAFPPEVKIRLKRDGKDTYSWELSGSDVDQILRINEKLKKQLGRESP
jgi:hypothetical protein